MMDNQRMDTVYPKIDLAEFLRGIIKTCRTYLVPGMILAAAAAVIMGFVAYIQYTPMYRAEASFTVRVTDSFYADRQYYGSSAAKQAANIFPNIVTSGFFGERLKEELGLDRLPSISAEVMGQTNIITLSVSSEDPKLAFDVLNCVMEIYPFAAEFVIGPTELFLLGETGVPVSPYNEPDFSAAGLRGALFGIAVWVGGSLLYWITHRTIENKKQLGEIMDIPCLCRLPRVRGQRNGCPVAAKTNDGFGFSEAVRLLRVRFEKATAKEEKVVMVTSAIQNEGKTTVSVNLAIALAQSGKKVLLVECDLRSPSVGEIFGMKEGAGFTEYLRGKCGIDDIIHKLGEEKIHVVFGGAPVSCPEKLLSGNNMKRFIESAKSSFDYVILDTPPCAMMADAAQINVLSDCVLLTVRQDFAGRRQILEGLRNISDAGKPVIGCVLNMAPAQPGKDSYYGCGKNRQGENKR